MPSLLIAFFGSSHADDVVVVNCFSKMMMAAGAESPAVATQSAKTDILQKIEEQRGNNHEHEQELTTEEEEEENEVEVPKTPPPQPMLPSSNAKMSADEVSVKFFLLKIRVTFIVRDQEFRLMIKSSIYSKTFLLYNYAKIM